jgi:hypothetical protein
LPLSSSFSEPFTKLVPLREKYAIKIRLFIIGYLANKYTT